MIPAILLALVLIALVVTMKMEKPPVPIQIGLLLLALLCLVWYFKGGPPKLPGAELEATRMQAIGHVLALEANKRLSSGDELLILKTSFPAWETYSKEMLEGVRQAMKGADGVTIRELDIVNLDGGGEVQIDGARVLRATAPQVQGADAILTAFPMMGDMQTPLPKLPKVYGYYDGPSNAWQALLKRKRLAAVAIQMIWRETDTPGDLNELQKLFRQEYVLATPENVDQFGGFR